MSLCLCIASFSSSFYAEYTFAIWKILLAFFTILCLVSKIGGDQMCLYIVNVDYIYIEVLENHLCLWFILTKFIAGEKMKSLNALKTRPLLSLSKISIGALSRVTRVTMHRMCFGQRSFKNLGFSVSRIVLKRAEHNWNLGFSVSIIVLKKADHNWKS